MAKKVVIIGGGSAGINVLEFLLRGNEESEKMDIILLKKEDEGFFSMCGLPFALQGMYGIDVLDIFDPQFYRDHGIDFRTSAEVVSISLEDQHVQLDSGDKIPYDDLVIATGGKPVIPPIKGTDLQGVYTLANRDDGELIEAAINDDETSSALIIGGGWIGLQAAVAFSKKGIETRVVEMLPSLLPSLLDPDMASIVEEWLEKDIAFVIGSAAEAILGNEHVESVIVDGEKFPADVVLISAGMRPNVDLARKAGVAIGEYGGVVVDRAFRARKDGYYLSCVYALGDCVEVIDTVTSRPRLSQLASTALVQARVVADNILGIGSSYETCLSPTVATISGLQVGAVGVTAEVASKYGVPIKIGSAVRYTKARFFPGKKMIIAKLIFEASAEKLIGAQIISEETVAERINELTLGISAEITARDIWMRERCFDPSVSMVEDVIVDAAMKAFDS